MNFGDVLFQLRTERGIYQKELAEYLDVSIGTISNYENGVHYPDLKSLCRIAEYFNVSADYLLGITTNSMPIDSLNVKLSDGYTVGGVLNSILELSQSGRKKMSKYLTMIRICEEMPQKEETINKQQVLLRRQKHTIERLNQTVGQQAQEIKRLKELLEEKDELPLKNLSEPPIYNMSGGQESSRGERQKKF